MAEKELLVDSLRRQLAEARDALAARESDLQNFIRKQGESHKDKGILERKEKSRLQKELESLERAHVDLEQARR